MKDAEHRAELMIGEAVALNDALKNTITAERLTHEGALMATELRLTKQFDEATPRTRTRRWSSCGGSWTRRSRRAYRG